MFAPLRMGRKLLTSNSYALGAVSIWDIPNGKRPLNPYPTTSSSINRDYILAELNTKGDVVAYRDSNKIVLKNIRTHSVMGQIALMSMLIPLILRDGVMMTIMCCIPHPHAGD